MDTKNITLEELAAAIQDGGKELMPLLWERTQRLIKMLILKHLKSRILPNYVDEEDVLQCGYFALLAAVRAFKLDGYKFNTYLNYSVQNAVNETVFGKSREPSEIKEYSYHNTVAGDDGAKTELVEFIKDEQAEYDVIEPVELTETQRIVIEAVDELPDTQRDIVRKHHFQNMTFKEIAELNGCSLSNIQQYERQAFRNLRKNKQLLSLYKDMNDYSFINSVNWFRTSPEYFEAIRAAERIIQEQERQGKYLSYGKKQAQIYLLLYKAEQKFKANSKYR
jgi:RNA polymerase sigma factor (sigma-70 family)